MHTSNVAFSICARLSVVAQKVKWYLNCLCHLPSCLLTNGNPLLVSSPAFKLRGPSFRNAVPCGPVLL